MRPQPALPLVSHEHYRREVKEDLFHACLNARLSKTSMRDRPPFLTASSRRVKEWLCYCVQAENDLVFVGGGSKLTWFK